MAGSAFFLQSKLLCLDLVNTVVVAGGERKDMLTGFPALIAWMERTGTLSAGAGRAVLSRWDGTPTGRKLLREAIALRGVLHAMAGRLVAGTSAGADAIAAVNRVLSWRPGYPQLVRIPQGYVSRFHPLAESPIQLLVPVAVSAAWLVEQGDRSLLRRCQNPSCILFFYDSTRNKRRRWCSMDGCGSRAKMAAYYRRKAERTIRTGRD
jgi:predicted RNA-binding Zn ribbon-like protein